MTRSTTLLFSTLLFGLLVLNGCKSQQPIGVDNQGEPTSMLPQETTDVVDEATQAEVESTSVSEDSQSNDFLVRGSDLERDVDHFLNKSAVFSSHFTGFSLYDIASNELLVNYNGDKYFTPASNVKVLTLYAVLRSFKHNLPAALYYESPDTLYIRPIGDPTFLHPKFQQQPLLSMLRNTPKPVAILWPKADLPSFGAGWMWDDYGSGYQPELSWMPLYGNVVHFQYNRAKITAKPKLFEDLIEVTKGNGKSNTVTRAFNYNHFKAEVKYPNWAFDKSVPFKYSQSLATQLLREASNGYVTIIPERKMPFDTLYTMPIDSVLRLIMQESDNFISEQLLVMAAWKNGFDNTEAFREYMAANWLKGMAPVWMDGSGLSRYNLIRPIDKVKLLTKLYHEFGWARIHNIFPHGGVSGTIKEWYRNGSNPSQPYIIAKTGTLANNHTLSGYMQTSSGRLLAFSFMNNNYVRSTSEVRREMQLLLEKIRDAY